jgi:hypothetical protein
MRNLVVLLVLLLVGCSSTDQAKPKPPAEESLSGTLLFSRFDEASHTFGATYVSRPDGSGLHEVKMPGPEGGGRWSRSGEHIAVLTLLPDGRVGTAIITPEGQVERTLNIRDKTLNLVCTLWSPDDQHLVCEGWDETDATRTGLYSVRSDDGLDLVRLTKPGPMVDFPGDYSPDGETLVFARGTSDEGGTLMTMPARGGKERVLYDEPVELEQTSTRCGQHRGPVR